MSSQSVATLFAQTRSGRSGFVCASSFSPAGCQKIWSDCFSREKKKLMLPHKHYDLKMSLQRKRRRKPKRPRFFFFCFRRNFIFFCQARGNGFTRRQPIRAQGQRNLPLPYHFPEFLYILTQKSEFSPPCSLDRNADASSPTFWERSHYSASWPRQKPQACTHAHTYTHTRTSGQKRAQLFNIITQAYAFAHISAEGPRRQSSLN